jgi:excisionase family DNA binding protein
MSTCTPTDTGRMAFRLNDVVAATGLSRRYLERLLAAGEMPAPDVRIRRTSLWHRETIDRWLRGQSQQGA